MDKNTKCIKSASEQLPWILYSNKKCTYDICIGKTKVQDLILYMLNVIGENDDIIEIDTSLSCLCSFKLTSDGMYIDKSFSISTYVWAVSGIIAKKSLNADLSKNSLDRLNASINEFIPANKKLEYRDLKEIYNKVVNRISFPLNNDIMEFCIIINEKFGIKYND